MRDTEVGAGRERWLAAALTGAGAAVIGLALIQRWTPHEMSPGVEGALTAGFFGPLLALLENLRFSRALALAAPIWILQLVACAAVSGPVVAVLGLEMVALGGAGLLLALEPWAAVAKALRRPARLALPRRDDADRIDVDHASVMRRSSSVRRA